eukprot:TRINITY_DN22536_c0_g1_i1.p1 TRINITY_DN22536_c0_g1~~TRINITY_DN22536_c0_g1_i1.p1  ORF type:complete len:199 (-),score=41.68 TRINITY_DN22536_c0_g1_i1:137-733(-)
MLVERPKTIIESQNNSESNIEGPIGNIPFDNSFYETDKSEVVQGEFFSETASELKKLTAQLNFEIEEPVQSMRPRTATVVNTSKKPDKLQREDSEKIKPKVDYRKKDKKVLFAETLRGVDEATKAEMKQKISDKIEAWKSGAKVKREQKLSELKAKRVNKGGSNPNNSDNAMVITSTIQKHGTRFSQRKNILHDLIYA